MSKKRQSANFFQSLVLVTIAVLSTVMLHLAYQPTALAADNYNAAMDGYQETRNPNRVNSSEEELKNSKIYESEKTNEDSIYDRLVQKVNKQKDNAVSKEETK